MEFLEFISSHRDEIIVRARAKVSRRHSPTANAKQLTNGLPIFLTQLCEILRQEAADAPADGAAMESSATQHGVDLLGQGFTISQVVHDYGDICQAITELAVDLHLPISTQDFQTLNRCLDNAIADAVTGYSQQRDVEASDEIRRQGFFAHELRNHLNTAVLALHVVKSGKVGVTGSTVAVLERSLRGLRALVDRSVSEVRLASGAHHRERVRLAEFIEEMELNASLDAMDRGLHFSVESVDASLLIDVDRHLFASAISNLLNNAFKFSRVSGSVALRIRSTADRVSIEIQDSCGGLAPGVVDSLFRPFGRGSVDHSGLGLGLAISRKAIEADDGRLTVRDLPGTGCVFTVDMPLALAPFVADDTALDPVTV